MSTWKSLVIGGLVAPEPVIQDGVGVDISLSPLTGAVVAEGGVGIISTAQIGFRESGFKKNPLEANLRAIGEEFQKARKIMPEGIIGFNIMVATKGYALYVKKAVKVRADIVISRVGLPIALSELVQRVKMKITPIVSFVKSAMVILKMWDRKYRVVPDSVVVEGPLAGGHLGFSVEQLEEIGASNENREGACRQTDYDEEARSTLRIIKGYTEKYRKKISVVTAGGIYNHEDMLHQMELGIGGVQVTVRFITTEKYDAPEAYEQAYVHVRQEDIVITRSLVGTSGRAIKNSLSNLVSEEEQPIEHCYQCLEKCDHKAIPYCIMGALVNATEGNTDRALMFCGSNAHRAERIETVADVLNDLLEDAH